jgi:hypothetical protein
VYGPAVDVAQYTEATLTVEFVDAKTRKVFWRGIAADTFGSASEAERGIDEAVRKMLEAYPPPPNRP